MQDYNALEHVDTVLWLTLASIVLTCIVSYALFPHVMPQEERKTPIWHFFLGTSCLSYYRGPEQPPMTAEDFPDSPGTPTFNIELFRERMESLWTPQSPGLLRDAITEHMKPWWIYSNIFLGMNRALSMTGQTFLISCIIAYMYTPLDQIPEFLSVKLMFLGFVVAIATQATGSWSSEILSIRGTSPITGGLQLMVLRKMHKLSLQGISQTTSSEAQQTCNEAYWIGVSCWMSPLKSIVVDAVIGLYALYQLYKIFGLISIVLGVVAIMLIWQVAKAFEKERWTHEQTVYQAFMERQGMINGMLDNFRALRMYDWLAGTRVVLDGLRATMRNRVVRCNFWGSMGGAVTAQIESVVVLIAYIAAIFQGQEKAHMFEKGLLAQAYLGTVMACLGSLFGTMGSWYDIHNKAERIEKFLRLPECNDALVHDGPLEIAGGSFSWPSPQGVTAGVGTPSPSTSSPILTDINFSPHAGELVLVCGAIGAGKSALLMALLGELPCNAGKVQIPKGKIAYQPQVPFLMEGTIRENMLFGTGNDQCNEANLQRALEAAQLTAEMDTSRSTLSAQRELTYVGKRGGSLSGGQRARTSLARSVYAALEGASLVLLDDPVASVDNEVVQAAWEGSVLRAMKGKTRVVVVNTQLLERLAPSADRLVVLAGGRIAFDGQPSEARSRPELLKQVLGDEYKLHQAFLSQEEAKATSGFAAGDDQAAAPPRVLGGEPGAGAGEDRPGSTDEEDGPGLGLANMIRETEALSRFVTTELRLSPEELQQDTPVEASKAPLVLKPAQWDELKQRLRRLEHQCKPLESAGKGRLTVPSLVLSFVNRMYWLIVPNTILGILNGFKGPITFGTIGHWVANPGHSDTLFLLTLGGQFFGFALLAVFNGFVDSMCKLLLQNTLVRDIDNTIVRLGMPFFWRRKEAAESQVRQVLNMDLGQLNGVWQLPQGLASALFGVAVTSMHAPSLWLVMAGAFLLYRQLAYLSDWKGTQLFPAHQAVIAKVWTRVIEQFDTLVSIRSLGRQRHFEDQLIGGMMNKPYFNYMNYQVDVLVGILNHVIGALFTMFAVLIVTRMKAAGTDSSVAFGFFTLANTLSGMVSNLCNMYVPFKECVSRWRMMEDFLCTDSVEPDSGPEAGSSGPPGWPVRGEIEFSNVTFRYLPHAPAALRNVSFTIRPAEKLGIVGKTGSGKSTLVSLLLRLGPLRGVPPESGGRVLIDGVDLATLNLSKIRRTVAVVPQEPVMFGGLSLKANVSAEATEAEVLQALSRCGLDVRQLGRKATQAEALKSFVVDASIGQQQLIMAARALVRKPRVLILDECTASLDRESADRLLAVISQHSKGATVLSIAHRIRFVLKSDRILVLALGKLVALDKPSVLLEDKESYFAVNLRLEEEEDEGMKAKAGGIASRMAAAAMGSLFGHNRANANGRRRHFERLPKHLAMGGGAVLVGLTALATGVRIMRTLRR